MLKDYEEERSDFVTNICPYGPIAVADVLHFVCGRE